MLTIYWKSGVFEGYTDLLPSRWFKIEVQQPFLTYDVEGPKGGRSTPRCSLDVRGKIADLDYGGEHRTYNERAGFDIGVMRLTFLDASRTDIRKVQWRDADNDIGWETVDVDWSERNMPFDELGTFDPFNIEDGRKRIERMVTLRQGQPGFRRALMDAYERRCAITGCTIDDVLEAAHISPYRGIHTNHVTNGLLLRADIHTLFDAGLIKVDRDCRITAPDHVRAAYNLPDHISLPQNPQLRPDPDALEGKWRQE